MDSGNSGSLQSSSGGGGGGGDDDFDAPCGGGPDSPSSSTSPLAALLRHPGFGGAGASALIYGLQDLAGAPPLISSHWCSTSPTAAPLAPTAGAGASPPCHGGLASAASPPAADQQQPSTPRGSRKRARASRRAPTTVLTTDTSNFRAMVQEFTGIPAPPFAAAGVASSRSRLDSLLFPSRSAAAAAALPQYLLRPFAHKLPAAYPPASTSSPAPSNAAAIAAPTSAPGTAAVAPGDGYQHHLTTAAPPALLRMQDHGGGSSYLSFQFKSANTGQLDGGGKYPMFDRSVAPPSAPRPVPVPDPADFLGLAHGVMSSDEERHAAHLHPRINGDRGDELSGLVGGCKATYSSVPPLLGRNGRIPLAGASTATATTAPPVAAATAAAVRTQGVDSWVCSSSE
ncbi:unnamed protein product [Urochloa decumbens]|uniref:VQ domain-containing protein n=1 Tax=Urochloa decumbens TaxID=240449 RepID=A0ABC9BFG8_9POAL